MDKIKLKVNSKLYQGWESVRIKKSMQSICHTFSMDIYKGDEVDITNNDLIQILVNNKVFLTGYIDNYDLDIAATKKPLSISGKSKAMDLVDCNIKENKQYNNITIAQIISDLIKPFNMTVSTTLKLEPLEKFNTKIGETYFNAINRLCKQTNTLPVSDENGNLILIKNQDNLRSLTLKDQDFKTLKIQQKYNNRYSEYTYKKETAVVDVQEATLKDKDIKRFRPFVGNNNEDRTNEDMLQWKKTNDISKSILLTGTILNWNEKINTIVKLDTQIVKNSYLIKDIEYLKGNNGTISNITFVDKNLFKDN